MQAHSHRFKISGNMRYSEIVTLRLRFFYQSEIVDHNHRQMWMTPFVCFGNSANLFNRKVGCIDNPDITIRKLTYRSR
ncbi:Uncharacterised protein [Salmonella enterica subsp. enterica serovar Typhi]|nr:Uncharacterised protein [Salmonella enterica subsp. enterica serovar Typhi]